MANLWMRMERFKKHIHVICTALELVAAGLTLIGILFSTFSLMRDFELFRRLLTDTSMFREYIEQIFTLVIGIEFLVMLCRPNSDNVIEVLIFLVARHMIVVETTPYQDFVSVVSVTILCVVRRYLRINNEKRGEKNEEEYIMEKKKIQE